MSCLADLLYSQGDDVVLGRFIELYPDQAPGVSKYHEVLSTLRLLDSPKSDLVIEVYNIQDESDDYSKYPTVSGRKGDVLYAINFTPWSEWLGMGVSDQSLLTFSPLDIVCHCLWEMTWNGFSQEAIKAQSEALLHTYENVTIRRNDE